MNLLEPTKKQYEVLTFIKSHKKEYGVLPTYSEIMDEFGYKSPNSVTQNLHALHDKGFLIKDEGGFNLKAQEQ